MSNRLKIFTEQQINPWINNKGVYGIIGDNSKISVFTDNISGRYSLCSSI